MKKIKYIVAAALAAFALSTSAFAVGDIIEGVESGAEDIIDGAGDAADDIIGDGSGDNAGDMAGDNTGDEANDVTTIDSSSEISISDSVTEAVTEPEITTEAITTMPEVTTGTAGLVNGDNNVNTGFVLTFTALGAAAAGLTAIAARKRK